VICSLWAISLLFWLECQFRQAARIARSQSLNSCLNTCTCPDILLTIYQLGKMVDFTNVNLSLNVAQKLHLTNKIIVENNSQRFALPALGRAAERRPTGKKLRRRKMLGIAPESPASGARFVGLPIFAKSLCHNSAPVILLL
jgi:hypothetical protein